MTLNGKTAAVVGVTAAMLAALASGIAVHLSYQGMVREEGVAVGASSAQIKAMDGRMTRHVAACDARTAGIVRELGEIRGTVDAIWRHMREHHREER